MKQIYAAILCSQDLLGFWLVPIALDRIFIMQSVVVYNKKKKYIGQHVLE